MKKSTFQLIVVVLLGQALIYVLLSVGSVLDLASYVTSGQQPVLSGLSFLAILKDPQYDFITSIWSVLLSGLAAIIFLVLSYIYEFKSETGRIWLILAIATAFWWGGETIWFYFTITTGVPETVTIADYVWLLGYPFYFLGLYLLNKKIGLETEKTKFFIYTAVIGIFSLIVLYVLGTAIFVPDSDMFSNLVYYGYVLGDLIMLYLAGLIFIKFSGGAEIRRSYMILILSFLITAIADFVYDFTSYVTSPPIYQTYSFDFADALYIVGYTLLAVGGLTYYYTVSKVLSD